MKKLGLQFGARIQLDVFEELFANRLKGSGARVPRSMKLAFREGESAQEKRIWSLIERWTVIQIHHLEQEVLIQEARLKEASSKLKVKATKKAQEDIRISSAKFDTAMRKMKLLKENDFEADDGEQRIYPDYYAPLIVWKGSERVIVPFRYRIEPRFASQSYSTYNARLDHLTHSRMWRELYGKNHGVLVISRFYESISLNHFEHRELSPGENEKRIEIEFKPKEPTDLLVPCIFDQILDSEFPLRSFALITDEPNPEVLAAGHERTPAFLKQASLDPWIKTLGKKQSDFDQVLSDQEETFFENSVASTDYEIW
ncbi:MAG: SOS response-associated peptidase family protein [Xanthomonadaceae bacterium]|nr:SOS response-associated peptidase family protein [Xanthomonadaceae bacterium]